MLWKETCTMDKWIRFVLTCLEGGSRIRTCPATKLAQSLLGKRLDHRGPRAHAVEEPCERIRQRVPSSSRIQVRSPKTAGEGEMVGTWQRKKLAQRVSKLV